MPFSEEFTLKVKALQVKKMTELNPDFNNPNEISDAILAYNEYEYDGMSAEAKTAYEAWVDGELE